MNPDSFQPRRRLTSRTAAREALDDTLSETRHSLRVFDDDGRFWGLDRRVVADTFGSLLRIRDSHVLIVLHDTGFVERDCPALVDLVRDFGPRLRLLRTDDRIRAYSRGMVIADDRVVLRRPQFGQSLTVVDYEDASIAQASTLFEEILGSTIPGVSGRATGL